jgi:ketosteroid isomerase-like protein
VSANLDLVHSLYVAWEEGDYSSTEWAHLEIEFVVADGPDPGTWHGLRGLAEGMASFSRAWQWLRTVPEEFRELDEERVLVLVSYVGRGKASGVRLKEVEARAASIYHVHDRSVKRIVLYFDRNRALADLGLASEGDRSSTSDRT